MIISKKKFNEAINEALYEHEKKIYRQRELDELNKRICRLEDEVAALTRKMNEPISLNCSAATTDFLKPISTVGV